MRNVLFVLLFTTGIAAAWGQAAPAGRASGLIDAAERGDAALLAKLIAGGAAPDAVDEGGNTALIAAAGRGHVDAVKALLKTPVKLDQVNRAGRTALLEAIVAGDGSPRFGHVVLLLSAAGANVNIADPDKVTPLDHARRKGYAAMAGILEHAGAR